jgi:hypothetical protein
MAGGSQERRSTRESDLYLIILAEDRQSTEEIIGQHIRLLRS